MPPSYSQEHCALCAFTGRYYQPPLYAVPRTRLNRYVAQNTPCDKSCWGGRATVSASFKRANGATSLAVPSFNDSVPNDDLGRGGTCICMSFEGGEAVGFELQAGPRGKG